MPFGEAFGALLFCAWNLLTAEVSIAMSGRLHALAIGPCIVVRLVRWLRLSLRTVRSTARTPCHARKLRSTACCRPAPSLLHNHFPAPGTTVAHAQGCSRWCLCPL